MRLPMIACLLLAALLLPVPASSTWGPMGAGMNNVVYSLATYNGRLIAGGAFTQSDGIPVSSIAQWNGTAWGPLGTGVSGAADTRVFALIEYDGALIAGGSFTKAGDNPANNIARWDGTSWSPLGSGVDGSVYALAVYQGKLIAGGDFILAGEELVNCIAQWDGSSWTQLGPGLGCVNCGNAFAVMALAVHGNSELIAGGWFNYAGGHRANYIASWTGTWAPLGSGMDYPVSALTDFNGDLIAGGAFSEAGGGVATGIARWDGVSWSSLGEGVVGWYNWVRALAIYNDNLIAGGYFIEAGGQPANHVAQWNGSTWSTLDEGTDDTVVSLTVFDDLLMVGGSFNQAGGASASKIASWDDMSHGACCQADGSCLVTTEAGCSSPGIWHGPGTVCDPNPCFHGACCLQYVCDWYTEVECLARGGHFAGNGTLCSPNPCTSAADESSQTMSLRLVAAPNPSTDEVLIQCRLPKPTTITVEVFDAAGSLVRRLADGAWPAGQHVIRWDGRDEEGNDTPSGVYLARMVTTEGTTTGRLVLAR